MTSTISEDALRGQQSRIMNAMRAASQPSLMEGFQNITQSLMSQQRGGDDYFTSMKKFGDAQKQASINTETSVYNMMKEAAARGDADAMAVNKAVEDVAGGDPAIASKLSDSLHNDKEPISRLNATSKVMQHAYALGINPLSVQESKAKLGLTNASIRKIDNDIAQSGKPDLPKPSSPEAKLKADFMAGFIDADTYKRAIAKQVAPTEKTYKQFQLQAASFADRMAKAEGLLQPYETSGATMVNNTASTLGKVPLMGSYLENKALTPDQQLYRNAASEWIRSKLRKESGAAIGDAEMDKEYRTYFPVPGDSQKVIKQKAELRKNNTASMIKQASGAYESQYLGEEPGQTSSAPAVDSGAGKVLIFDAQGNLVK